MTIERPSRREREKIQRRNDILKAAEKRFFEKAYDSVSMDDIASDVELSKGTLYQYFANKESLYFAVVIRGMIILRDTMKTAIEKGETGLKKILAFFQSSFEYMRSYANYYRMNLASRGARFAPMMQKGEIEDAGAYVQLAVELLSLLQNSVALGISDGSLRRDLDPLLTTIFLASALDAVIQIAPEYQLLLQQYHLDKEHYLHHSLKMLLNGIVSEKTT